jgi:thiamine-monophosphate kinase
VCVKSVLREVKENRLLGRWADLLPRSVDELSGVHESDAELVPLPGGGTLALTVDGVSEEIEQGLYQHPSTAGRVAALASLSDLAAVGADPLGLLLSVTLPQDDASGVQEQVARGVQEVCTQAGVHVLGGDTSSGPRLTVTSVGVGLIPAGIAPLRRTGMRSGDWLFASGLLGQGGALAASRWLGAGDQTFGESDYRPRPTLEAGRSLRGIASACMDTSDGLVATLDQLARVNGVAVQVERSLEELLEPKARRLAASLGLPPFAFLAGVHGEFELVFAVPEERLVSLGLTSLTPVFLGRVREGAGLTFRSRPVDGARVRNLLDQTAGDVEAYARALVALDPESVR